MEKDKVQSNDEISKEDLKRVNIEPAALSDADLDNVAGGMTGTVGTNSWPDRVSAPKTYLVK